VNVQEPIAEKGEKGEDEIVLPSNNNTGFPFFVVGQNTNGLNATVTRAQTFLGSFDRIRLGLSQGFGKGRRTDIFGRFCHNPRKFNTSRFTL
jgi:hypothetical protein